MLFRTKAAIWISELFIDSKLITARRPSRISNTVELAKAWIPFTSGENELRQNSGLEYILKTSFIWKVVQVVNLSLIVHNRFD